MRDSRHASDSCCICIYGRQLRCAGVQASEAVGGPPCAAPTHIMQLSPTDLHIRSSKAFAGMVEDQAECWTEVESLTQRCDGMATALDTHEQRLDALERRRSSEVADGGSGQLQAERLHWLLSDLSGRVAQLETHPGLERQARSRTVRPCHCAVLYCVVFTFACSLNAAHAGW